MKLKQSRVEEPGPDEGVSLELPGKPINVIHKSSHLAFTWFDYGINPLMPDPVTPSRWAVVCFVIGDELNEHIWEYVSSIAIPGDRTRHFFTRQLS